jgi:hypothetical protein
MWTPLGKCQPSMTGSTMTSPMPVVSSAMPAAPTRRFTTGTIACIAQLAPRMRVSVTWTMRAIAASARAWKSGSWPESPSPSLKRSAS